MGALDWLIELNNKLKEIVMKPFDKKIALVVGHTTSGDRGAYSPHLEQSEFDFWIDVANKIKALGKSTKIDVYDIFTHTEQNYYNRQRSLSQKVNRGNYDYVVELHFNAATPSANGTECLHYFSSKKGKEAAQKISQKIAKEYGTKLRGVGGAKALINKNDRGYWFVYLPIAPAVILEPFFGSNEESLKFKDKDKLAKVLHEALISL